MVPTKCGVTNTHLPREKEKRSAKTIWFTQLGAGRAPQPASSKAKMEPGETRRDGGQEDAYEGNGKDDEKASEPATAQLVQDGDDGDPGG